MSIEDLQSDLAANMEEAKNLSALSSMGDVVNHLKNTLWPFQQNLVGELVDMDQALQTMYEQSDDILQFETGKLLASVIVGAQALVADLEQLIKDDPTQTQRRAAIKEWKAKAKEAIAELEEITLPEDASAADEEDDDDDDDDADDDGDDIADGDGDGDDDAKKETAHA